ncbi:hypothetical protein ACBJ59_19545 [Nonomuraea sp. MTCD27]|uniref:hypothetical protein n=1 Tax=Nonomuraea sp. MTCD27 TaxID=1676747 RepID=UPI0035BFB35A
MTGELGRSGDGVGVGIVLPRPQGDPGEWLTDAVAFEAAGADALWVEHGSAPALDPLTLTAALAAVTYRSLLVVAVAQRAGEESGEAWSHALATVERLSRGRLVLIRDFEERTGDSEELVGDPDAGDGAGQEARAGRAGSVRTVVRLADGGYREGGTGGRWAAAGVPGGRGPWREVLREAAERGDRGVLVPADPRLLDLLRNPEDPGGRHDLQLAQG